ncbi:MAG: ComEC family competence protein [Rickettsiales bacterium]|jgi:competence protein ComEC|nr:ComEC family competence protein [Rickettsiales bacterium]
MKFWERFIDDNRAAGILFAPFVMAMGVGVYFAWPSEPAICFPILISLLCLANLILGRCRAVMLFALGFFWACGYAQNFGTPAIPRDMRNIEITGRVDAVDYRDGRTRITIGGNRMVLPAESPTVHVGDTVTATATLFKPGPSDIPGGFDFARHSYFNGLSGTGWADNIEISDSRLEIRLRDKIHDHVAARGNGTATGLVDSLVLGHTYALPKSDMDVVRGAGIAHIFSISGFHMTLVGAWLFALFYLVFRSVPWITRRSSARNPAIILSGLGLVAYLFLSGAQVATMRSLFMAGFVYLALLLGRRAVNMRSVALTMGALLIINPAFLLDAGFQLSFAAIFGLVYFTRRYNWIVALVFSSIIAGVFTMPFVAFNFTAVQTYGILGNLFAVPIFSFLIMPAVLLTLVFGWAGDLAALFYQWMILGAKWVAGLPGAEIYFPYISPVTIWSIIIGACCAMFLDKKWKWICTLFFAAAVTITGLRPTPLFYISHDSELAAIRTDSGALQFNRGKSSDHRFTFDSFEKFNGTYAPGKTRKPIRKGFAGKMISAKCETGFCIYQTPNFKIAHIQKFVPLYKNIRALCADPDIKYIATFFRVTVPNCHAKIIRGGTMIYDGGRIQPISANRIWHK